MAQQEQWGIFNYYPTPYLLTFILSIVALDFIIYLQHVVFHAIPVLWRLHRVHHSDLDLDVTSAVRFHFLEILISAMIKLSAIALLGAPVLAVLAFEVLLNATAMFNHANIRLPDPLDRVMRWVIVTPDMHRMHHSVVASETNSNFGFNMPWWDYLCGTYRAQPAAGHDHMTIGVTRFRDERDQYLDRLLVQPFIPEEGEMRSAQGHPTGNVHLEKT